LGFKTNKSSTFEVLCTQCWQLVSHYVPVSIISTDRPPGAVYKYIQNVITSVDCMKIECYSP